MIDPKALETLFRYTIGDFKRNKEAEEAMTYERSRGPELIPEGADMSQYNQISSVDTPKQVQEIGDLEKGLASLSRAIPRTNLGTVSTEGMLSDEQKKLIGQEEKSKKKEVKEYNLSGPDYPKADEEKIISTPTDTSRYTFTPSQLYKGIKDNDDRIYNYIYQGISKKEWKGQDPIFDFVGYGKGLDSSAFGPAQIVYSTAEPLLKNIKNKETKNFAKKMIAAQKIFKNMINNRNKYQEYRPKKAVNTERAREEKWLETLGITEKEFLDYVNQGYFLPSNHPLSKTRRKKGLVTGIPLELLGDNYKENYFNLFKTVLKQKEKESKTKSLEDVIQRYHGANDKDKDESYQKGVFKNLFDTTNPYDKPIKDNETEIEVRPSYQPITTKKQSGGRIESDPYKRQPRFI